MAYRLKSQYAFDWEGETINVGLTELTVAQHNRLQAARKAGNLEAISDFEIFKMMDGWIHGPEGEIDHNEVGLSFMAKVFREYHNFLGTTPGNADTTDPGEQNVLTLA